MRTKLGLVMVAALAGGLLAASAARADNLDDALIREGSTIVKKLREKGYKTVGVLQFGLKIGAKPSTWNGGSINKQLPEYLENALVMCNDIDRPLHIIRDASKVAGKATSNISLVNTADRTKLFKAPYKTWDNPPKSVSPDVLLTGQIALSKDYKQATVTVLAFDKNGSDKIATLHKFAFPSDNYLLGDSGIGYSMSRKYKTVRKFGRNELDSLVDVDPEPDNGNTSPNNTNSNTSNNTGPISPGFPVDLRIFYDDAQQTPLPESSGSADKKETYTLADPKENQKVRLKIKNTTDAKLGVVLMFGGYSTLYERENWRDAEKWVLEPGKDYDIMGFYQEGDAKYKPFKVLSDTDSESIFSQKGEASGRIELYVFRPGTEEAVLTYEAKRSLRQPLSLSRKPATQKDLEKLLQKRQKLNARGLIVAGDGTVDTKVESDTLGTVVLTDTMIIQYYKGGSGNTNPNTDGTTDNP